MFQEQDFQPYKQSLEFFSYSQNASILTSPNDLDSAGAREQEEAVSKLDHWLIIRPANQHGRPHNCFLTQEGFALRQRNQPLKKKTERQSENFLIHFDFLSKTRALILYI